jgi:hypothetical protein
MNSQSTKDPQKESQNPASMPREQQGQGAPPKPKDPEGQQGHAHHAKMAVHSDSPPGIELDGKAHVIPLEERTEGDQRKAKESRKTKD